MTKRWLWLMGLLVLAAPARSQMTAVTATVQDANGQHYVNCSWSVVFVGQNTIPGAGPYQPAALLVGQQGSCNSSGVLTVSLADNIATVRPTPSQWNFSICSAPGYIPGGTYCRSNMLVTITGASQNLTSFFQPLMPLLPSGGGGGGSQYITDATPLGGLMRTGSTLGLQTTCIAGQYLGWNGSAWACTTPGGGGVNSGTLVTVNGTQAVPNQLNFNSTSPLPPAGSQNVVFQLNGNSVSGYVPAGGGGGGSLTVNGATGGSDLNDILPPFPPNGINISWQAANGHISGAIVGDGIATHCFLGTGVFAQCPGSGASAGVSSINGLTGALSFTGAVSCSGTTCNFTGGGAGGLPTIPQYNLFASTGAGGAQDSAVKAGPPGFLQAEVVTATGDITSAAAPFQLFPNAGVEYFPTGYAWSGGTAGATNGLAMYMSHSSGSTASANGGVALGGGNSSSTGNQVYLDCETSGCDFKVAPTYLGASIGGGGGSGTVASGTGNYFAWYASTGTTVTSNSNLSDNGALITSQEPIAAPGINVTGSGGIAMTGAGGTLPAPASGQGGIGIGPGNVPEYYSNGGAWTAIGSGGGGGITGPTANGGLTQTSTTLGLLTTCTTNQYLSFNGTAWVCTPAPTGGGTVTGATANGGLVATGNTLGLLTSCSSGQVLQWNGTAWACTTPTGGGSGSGTVSSATGAAGQLAYYPPSWVASRSYILNALIVDSNNNVQKVTTAGTSGASAPTWATTLNGTTSDGTVVWTVVQVGGGSTYVAPLAVTISSTGGSAAGAGLNLGFGLLQFASNIVGATPDASIGRPAANLLVFGNGTTNSVSTMIFSGNSCAPSADISLSTTQTLICSKTFPASARTWIFRCTVPWGFTGGTGNATMQFLLNLSAAPTTRTFLTTWTISPTGPSNYGAVQLSGAGNTTILTTSALNVADATIFTTFIEGSINAPAAGMNSFLYMVIGSGATSPTASAYAGAFCRYE